MNFKKPDTLKNQKQVWNNIAEEWFEFKTNPAEHVFEFLKDKTGNILDLGSGAGRHLIKIKEGKMYLVDFSEEMIRLAQKKSREKNIDAEFFVSDLAKLPFKDNFFDSAIAISSIHCIETPEARKKAVEELFRVLKPNSEVLVGVWNKNSKRFKNSPKERYVKWREKGKRYYYLFDEKEIHDLFRYAGFKIKKTLNTGMMINFIAERRL